MNEINFYGFFRVATLVEGLKWSKKEGKSFVLKNVGTNVRNALTLTKLESVFQIMPDSGHPENPG
jgi:anti-anti-sigma regulatory factor